MLSTSELTNLKKKWNDICTRCYKENEEYKENKIACGTYFPGQPISKFFLDGKPQEECDLFNCNRCNKIKDGNQGHQWFFESGRVVDRAPVRWTARGLFGLEFLSMQQEEHERLRRFVTALETRAGTDGFLQGLHAPIRTSELSSLTIARDAPTRHHVSG